MQLHCPSYETRIHANTEGVCAVYAILHFDDLVVVCCEQKSRNSRRSNEGV